MSLFFAVYISYESVLFYEFINVNAVLHNQVINQDCFVESALLIRRAHFFLTDLLASA